MPSHTPPALIVDDYHRSWTSGDLDHALALVADDVQVTAPDPDVATKADWRAYLEAFVPMLTAAPEVTRMTDDDRVALWYHPQTDDAKTVLASELFTIRDGLISEIRLTFDRMGYGPPPSE